MASETRSARQKGSARAGRVVYLTGKGGAGKSTLSTLLARRAAARGLRSALIETGPAGGPRRSAEAEPFDLHRLDERTALGQMLARLLRVRFLAGRLMDSRVFSAVAAAAPGVRELVYMSYILDVATGRVAAPGRPRSEYPQIVFVDGYATGHTISMLTSPYTSAELIPIGPAARIAREIGRTAASVDRFRVLSVTLPEELAATESRELRDAMSRIDVAIAATVVNGVYPDRFGAAPETYAAAIAWLRAETRVPSRGSTDALLYESRRDRQLEIIEGIRACSGGCDLVALPYEFDGNGGGLTPTAIDAVLEHCIDGLPTTAGAGDAIA